MIPFKRFQRYTLHLEIIVDKRNIVIGVTGSIAAYKTVELCRRLRENNTRLKVVMTRAAGSFITPLSFQAVSGSPVRLQLLDASEESGMDHIELARWADHIVVAPATANFLAKLAHGFADDLLSTLCLAASCPVIVAPAMNQAMWTNPATQANVSLLQQRDINFIGPESGDQACGDHGPGRMSEPTRIIEFLRNRIHPETDLCMQGLHILVTAGPTFEAIDPVRGLTNTSSGKMGYAIAAAAHAAGAQVTLISGPVVLPRPVGVITHCIISALQMQQVVLEHIKGNDIFISVAAVADYRPKETALQKIKKNAPTLTLELVRNPDILTTVATLDKAPFTVGFAAETEQLLAHAGEKLNSKGVNMIAANRIGQPGTGIGADENALTLITRNNVVELKQAPKSLLARQLIQVIAEQFHKQADGPHHHA